LIATDGDSRGGRNQPGHAGDGDGDARSRELGMRERETSERERERESEGSVGSTESNRFNWF